MRVVHTGINDKAILISTQGLSWLGRLALGLGRGWWDSVQQG